MRTWPWLLLALALIVSLLSLAPVRIRVRWRLRDGRQRLTADLDLIFGLIHLHRELPPLHLKKLALPTRSRTYKRKVHRYRRWGSRVTPLQGMLAAKALRGRLHVRRLRLRLSLGTGNAATTALAYGGAWAAISTALAASRSYLDFQTRPEIGIEPDFHQAGFAGTADCILALRLTDIMRAAWRLVRH